MKSFCRLAIVFLLLATAHSFAEKRWIEVRNPHFSVVSDVGEKRASEMAGRFEQVRAAFSILMNRATTNDPAPLLIFALNGEKEVAELAGERNRNSAHTGLFLSRADKNFVLSDAADDPWAPAFHEYVHELLTANASVQTYKHGLMKVSPNTSRRLQSAVNALNWAGFQWGSYDFFAGTES